MLDLSIEERAAQIREKFEDPESFPSQDRIAVTYGQDAEGNVVYTSIYPDGVIYTQEEWDALCLAHAQAVADAPDRARALADFPAPVVLPQYSGLSDSAEYEELKQCMGEFLMSTYTTDKSVIIAEAVETILWALGENPERDGLKETPMRVAKAMLDELFAGYAQDPEEVLKAFDYDDPAAQRSKGIVIVKDIPLYSMCEHHMIPFFGKVHIAYLPNKQLVGLSKLARLTEVFARRLQVQERLTDQIADAIMTHLDAKGVFVVADARHLCMEARGIGAHGAHTITSAVRGVFRDVPAAREEVLHLLK